MNSVDTQYVQLIDHILTNGINHQDRTGVGTLRVFGHSMRFNLNEGFPAITVKRIGFKNTVAELLWFIQSKYKDCKISDLESIYPSAKKWWVDFEKEDNTIGPMYTRQLTNFNGQALNQIDRLVNRIKSNPNSRRHLLTTYNPLEADEGSLYVCHGLTTMFTVDNGVLNCGTVQRSADTMLGIPANIASYTLLTYIIAQVCNLKVGELYYTFMDAHIYSNHIEAAKEIIRRYREEQLYTLPTLKLNPNIKNIDDFKLDDFQLENYQSLPSIKLPIAI